jgi:hypothetical protein
MVENDDLFFRVKRKVWGRLKVKNGKKKERIDFEWQVKVTVTYMHGLPAICMDNSLPSGVFSSRKGRGPGKTERVCVSRLSVLFSLF